MTTTDLLFRKEAIPYLGTILGYNRNEQSDNDISVATDLGDLKNLSNWTDPSGGIGAAHPPLKDNYIRILKPEAAHIVAAFLSMVLRTDPTEPYPYFYISVTKTVSDIDITVVPLSDDQIITSHRQIAGTELPFSNSAGQPIVLTKLDISTALPAPESPDFRKDCFVIGVHFKQAPATTGYHLGRFGIDCSALIIG